MNGQMSIFDCFPELTLKPGDYVETHGAVICHIMRPGMIGKMVVYDCSTQSHKWFRAGILEDYIPYEGRWRSIIYVGKKERILLTHYPGQEIYELKPWNWEDHISAKRRQKCQTTKSS